MSVSLSVVVPTWNRRDLAIDCVRALLRQDWPGAPYEVIVVDDGSADGTADAVRELRSADGQPDVRVVATAHAGVNAARNAGIAAAHGQTVVFLDDDVVAPRGYLREVERALRTWPEAAGVGGPYRDYGGCEVRTCAGCSLASATQGERVRRTDHLVGGNMCLRRASIDRAGAFHEGLSGFGDESEWFGRHPRGAFVYDPSLWVWHRRDRVTLWQLCVRKFRQGRAIPHFVAARGRRYRPDPDQVLRHLLHAARHGCGKGLVGACLHAGGIVEHVLLRTVRRP